MTRPPFIEPPASDLVLEAYGDHDDHFRLAALVTASQHVPSELQESAVEALEASTPWHRRFGVVEDILEAWKADGPRVVLSDPDALPSREWEGGRLADAADEGDPEVTPWDDADFTQGRQEMLVCLAETAEAAGWSVLRPVPRPETTRVLGERALDDPSGFVPTASWEALVEPWLRPVLHWALERSVLDVATIWDFLDPDDNVDPTPSFLFAVYQALRPATRSEARVLSVVRGPKPLDGLIGGIRVVDDGEVSDEQPRVSRSAIRELEACGFLQRSPSTRGAYWIPRPVRAFLSWRSWLLEPEERAALHKAVVPARIPEGAPTPEVVARVADAHHDAVMSASVEDAVKTARFWGADVRTLAITHSRNKEFDQAAAIFERIVRDYDSSDAYAWEYLGYNLARQEAEREPEARLPRVDQAYKQAAELAPGNPLYWGRWLGYRAQFGDEVMEEFERCVRRFRAASGLDGVVWFAKAAIQGMERGARLRLLEGVRARWRTLHDLAVRVRPPI